MENYEKDDLLVIMDSDNTQDPLIIPDLYEKICNNKLDIVVASRFVKGGKEEGVTFLRKILSRGAGIFCKILFNVPGLNDYTCGYRIYKVEFIKNLDSYYNENIISSKGFECMVEIIVKSKKLNAKIGEFPLVLKYDLKKGNSKMKIFKTIFGYFRLGYKFVLELW